VDDDEYLDKLMAKAERTLDDVANDVRKHLSGAVENIIKAGQALQEGRDMHPSDNDFHDWCVKEFPELSRQYNYNLRKIASRFHGVNFSLHLPKLSILVELSADSVPDELVEDFVSSQEPVKVKEVKEAKKEYKAIQEEPEYADLFERVQQKEITPREAIIEKQARMPVERVYDLVDAMSAITGIAWLYVKNYKGTSEDAADVLIQEIIGVCEDGDDIDLSIAKDRIKWFLEFKEALDYAEPALREFLTEKPNLKIVK
jgi:hypothetical protein